MEKPKAGLSPRFWFIGFWLAPLTPPTPLFLLPVSFDQNPAVTAVLPAMRDPDRVAMRGRTQRP